MIYREISDQLEDRYLDTNSSFTFLTADFSGVISSIIKVFLADKKCLFFKGRAHVNPLTLIRYENGVKFDAFKDYFYFEHNKKREKTLIIIEDYQYLLNYEPSIIESLVSFYEENINKSIMILIIDNHSFVNNVLFKQVPKLQDISSNIYVPNLKYYEIKKLLPIHYNNLDILKAYAITGGVASYLALFESTLSDSIIDNFIRKETMLSEKINYLLLSRLREVKTYNTYLMLIAANKDTLREMYLDTRHERAKISTYLSNLILSGIIKRNERSNYSITNNLLHFYFRFIFPNLSWITTLAPDHFFSNFIANEIDNYACDFFKSACLEYLEYHKKIDILPFVPLNPFSYFFYKRVKIEIYATDGIYAIFGRVYTTKTLVGTDAFYVFEEYINSTINELKVTPYYYLFSLHGFSQELINFSKQNEYLKLIDFEQMMEIQQ